MARHAVVIRAAVCVVAGAATTFAVAWVLTLQRVRGKQAPYSVALPGEASKGWSYSMENHPFRGVRSVTSTSVASRGRVMPGEPEPPDTLHLVPRWSRVRRLTAAEARASKHAVDGSALVIEYAAGWPLPALYGAEGWTVEMGKDSTRVGLVGLDGAWLCERLGAAAPQFEALPTRPLWPGFAGNTAAAGAVFFGIASVPAGVRGIRRRRRRRRGLCERCGYPRGDGAGACPECGGGSAG